MLQEMETPWLEIDHSVLAFCCNALSYSERSYGDSQKAVLANARGKVKKKKVFFSSQSLYYLLHNESKRPGLKFFGFPPVQLVL